MRSLYTRRAEVTTEARIRRRQAAWWTAGGVTLFALTYVLLAGRPVARADEAWFLWIAHRVAHGEVLYRDVYSVTTPIPTWITAAALRVFGTQLLVVRAFSVACFAGSALVGSAIAARFGLGRTGRVLLVIGMFGYASPVAHFVSVYSQLAVLTALLAFWCALVWFDDPGRGARLLVASGLAAAVSFGSKPNLGLLTWLSVLVVVVIRTGRVARNRRLVAANAGIVSGSFVGVSVATLAPVAATGGFSAFVGDVVTEKPEYIRLLGGDFPPGAQEVTRLWAGGVSASGRFLATQPLLILFAIGLLAVAMRNARGEDRLRLAVPGLLVPTAIVAAYPQAGPQHLTEVMPLVLTSMAAAAPLVRSRTPRQPSARPHRVHPLAALVGVWLSLGAVLVAFQAVRGLPDLGSDEPPHFAGTVTGNPPWTGQRGQLEALRRSTRGNVFIVRSDASYFYLAGSLENPTPYDFAVRSDFGVNGERGVVKAIARGHPRWVCIHLKRRERHKPDVRPRAVERAVQAQLRLVARSRVCDLYRAP